MWETLDVAGKLRAGLLILCTSLASRLVGTNASLKLDLDSQDNAHHLISLVESRPLGNRCISLL